MDTKPEGQSQPHISPTAGVHTMQKSVRAVTGLRLWEASPEVSSHLHKHRGHDFCAQAELLGGYYNKNLIVGVTEITTVSSAAVLV